MSAAVRLQSDPCLMLSVGTGLRGCTCKCSDAFAHTLECVGRFDATGDFHGTDGKSCIKRPCALRRINLALELQGLLHLVLIVLFILLSTVFRGLDALHPQLHHLVDITTPALIFHAKFHNSAGVVLGALVWTVLGLVAKGVFAWSVARDFFYAVGGDCAQFTPCVDGELTFYSLLFCSFAMIMLNIWEIKTFVLYRRVLVESTVVLKKILYGK